MLIMSNHFLLITSQEGAAAAVELAIAAAVESAAAVAVTDAAAVAVLADRLSAWAAWQEPKDKPRPVNMLTDGVKIQKDGENMSIFSVFWREQSGYELCVFVSVQYIFSIEQN